MSCFHLLKTFTVPVTFFSCHLPSKSNICVSCTCLACVRRHLQFHVCSWISEWFLPPLPPRRHPKIIIGIFCRSRTNLDFWERGLQRIAEKYAKDCWKFAGGQINTQRILGAKSLPQNSELGYSLQDKFKFICWKIASSPFDLQSKLWKLALLIDVFDRITRPHFHISHKSFRTGRERLGPQSKSIFSYWEKNKELV